RIVESDLPRSRSTVLGNRAGFAPNELGPAGPEADVAAKGQVAGRSVEVAVAAFHRMNAPAIADGEAADANRLLVNRKIVRRAQVKAEPGVLGNHFIDGFVFEEACHMLSFKFQVSSFKPCTELET